MKNVVALPMLLMIILFSLILSCKKKYERPDQFSVDLFENERNEQKKKFLSEEEASEKSLFVIKSDSTELMSETKTSAKTLYIYKINSGKFLKKSSDSIQLPVQIISDYKILKIPSQKDSITLYLIDPLSFKLLTKELDVKYQALPSAPVMKP